MRDGYILLAYDPRNNPMHYYELNKRFFYLPGGHIEFQESAEKAAVREIMEETGYKAKIVRFLGTIENAWSFSGDEICCHTHEIQLVFQADIPGITPNMKFPQKEAHVAFEWVAVDKLCDVDIRPSIMKNRIAQWLNSAPNPNTLISSFDCSRP